MTKSTARTMADSLKYVSDLYSDRMVQMMNKSLFVDKFLNKKPVKYYFRPLFTLKIPYLYIDMDYENDRKGLFLGFKEIEVGKIRYENKDYKKEKKEWKNKKGLVYFFNKDDLKIKGIQK